MTEHERIDGIEVWPARLVVCSRCGARVQMGAPSEVCCPPLYDAPSPQWVYDFHAKHGVWPKYDPPHQTPPSEGSHTTGEEQRP